MDNLPIYHAVQAVEGHLNEMQEAFDKAIVAARENMAAERAANENTAQEGGVQMQRFGDDFTSQEIQQIRSIGQVSINSLTSRQLRGLEKVAAIYWRDLKTKSPFFRAFFGDWRENDTTPVCRIWGSTYRPYAPESVLP